jgi:hypothetical protein
MPKMIAYGSDNLKPEFIRQVDQVGLRQVLGSYRPKEAFEILVVDPMLFWLYCVAGLDRDLTEGCPFG